MNVFLLSVEVMAKVDEILLIGFDDKFAERISRFSKMRSTVKLVEFGSPFVAFRWMEEKARRMDNNLKAVIYDYETLEKENFLFIEDMREETLFSAIPFIVISDKEIGRVKALQLGIDDCYPSDVQGDVLLDRIEFLRKYKKNLQQVEHVEEHSNLKYPLSKRIFDIILASTALILASPIMLLTAIAIRLESKGSVIYKSKRVGTGYHVFDFLKFRSMYPDADKRVKELMEKNQYSSKENGNVFFKMKNDPRITKVGHFIRKTSIDELPQLINIIKGDMSIVGNRPLPLYEGEQLTKDQWAKRFLAPAGLTGLWQVTKRGKSDMSVEERIELDINYADNHSFWYDIKIILKTIPAMFQSEDV